MTALLRSCRFRWLLLVLPLALAWPAAAQLNPVYPLRADPARAIYLPRAQPELARPAALALPFFDDFTSPLEGAPSSVRWQPGGGALVNNRFALRPLTRGTATLDGLRAGGQPYNPTTSISYGTLDSLTSQPIDLGGLTTGSQVYLSFAWQAGTVAGGAQRSSSSTPVSLELLVLTQPGRWESVWIRRGLGTAPVGFRQQVIDLNQTRFLHSNFRFRFVATGITSENRDAWGLDYVLLDQGRAAALADTVFTDIATSAGLLTNPAAGLTNPLRRYTSLPTWQFDAAATPQDELSPELGVNISNLSTGLPLLINWQGTVRALPGGTPATWLQNGRPILTVPRQDTIRGNARRAALPAAAATRRFRYTLALNTGEGTASGGGNPRTLPNDTISRDVELADYYAYDDSTPEGYGLMRLNSTGAPVSWAYRIDLNKSDQVRALRLYPVFTPDDLNPRPVTIAVWPLDASGGPAAQPLATRVHTLTYAATTPQGFVELAFDQPVPVSGSFYVGFSQPSTGRFLFYGVDLNSTVPTGYFQENRNFTWAASGFSPAGALLMRPVLTNNVLATASAATVAASFSLYPNPSRADVTVSGPAFVRATVLDALGRTVWEQPATQAGRPLLRLGQLPPGVYLVRLALPGGGAVTRRLLLE